MRTAATWASDACDRADLERAPRRAQQPTATASSPAASFGPGPLGMERGGLPHGIGLMFDEDRDIELATRSDRPPPARRRQLRPRLGTDRDPALGDPLPVRRRSTD